MAGNQGLEKKVARALKELGASIGEENVSGNLAVRSGRVTRLISRPHERSCRLILSRLSGTVFPLKGISKVYAAFLPGTRSLW
jgi:hypothetical protein